MNTKLILISALTILEYRSFELDRKRRTILNVMEFQSHAKNVPEGLAKQLNDALVETDLNLNWVQRILRRLK